MKAARVALGLALVGGALWGEALWRGEMRARSSGAPPGWRVAVGPEVYRLSELEGPLQPNARAWSLSHWRTIRPGPGGPRKVAATVQLPPDGQVELWAALPGRDRGSGVGVVLDRVGEAASTVVTVDPSGARTVARCDRALPAPGEGPVAASIAPMVGGGVEVQVAGATARCAGRPKGEPAIRAGLRRVLLSDLRVGAEAAPPPGPPARAAWWVAGALAWLGVAAFEFWRGGRAELVALTTAPLLLAGLLAGTDMRLWVETARAAWLPADFLPALIPAGLAAVAKTTWHLGRWLREGTGRDWPRTAAMAALLPAVPAYAVAPGGPRPAGGMVAAVALGFAVVVGAAFILPAALRYLGARRPVRSATGILAVGGLAAVGLAFTHPLLRLAVLAAGGVGVALGLLVWANANAPRVRGYNLVSLGAVCLAVIFAEGAVRYTPAGLAWSRVGSRTRPDDIFGWVPTANQDFQRFQHARHTTYPDRGYPVAIPPADGRLRIVAMGGSTTGGAFQNDDLSQFYPARLQERLGAGYQVLNQGVGGWTTWHIRRYVDRELDALAPDVMMLYIGHNDILTAVPEPYAELYRQWEKPGPVRWLSDHLGRFRLYNGLRYVLVASGPSWRRVAVPVSDARANLEDIIAKVTDRGGRVILASEALAPDPGPLASYFAMMADLATKHDRVDYVDTARRLYRASAEGAPLFLDDCHLTPAGHRLLASILYDELVKVGVVHPPSGSNDGEATRDP